MVKEGEVMEMHFEFCDKNKHDIDPCVLMSYYLLLTEYCKINKINLSILPGQDGSFVSNALIIGCGIAYNFVFNFAHFLDTDTGQYISYKTIGKSMEDLKNEAKKEAEEKRNKNLYKKKSAFFKECLECKDIESIKVKKEGEEKSYCEIKREKFNEYIVEDDEENEEKNNNIEMELTEEFYIKKVKITQTGKVAIRKEDESRIKETKKYKEIISKFSKDNVNAKKNSKKEEVKQLYFNFLDEKLEKK